MDQRTRVLLTLLGSDGADAVLQRLEKGPTAKTALAAATGLPSREVARVLELLLLAGLVRYRKERGKGGGRPREVWELADKGELRRLDAYVRTMRHRLLDG